MGPDAAMAPGFWKGKRVLVTGGAGFIGSHVAEALYDAGAIVTIASRFRTRGFRLVEHLKGKASFAEGDLTDAEQAAACTRGKDAVLHFASKIAGLRDNSAHSTAGARVNRPRETRQCWSSTSFSSAWVPANRMAISGRSLNGIV